MDVGVLGVNFKAANLSLREAIARGAEGLAGEKARFFPYPTVFLSTCNRTEVYFSAPDLAEAHGSLLAFLRTRINVPFEQKLYSFFGVDCLAHLGRVTAGLDSAILAETEIQRQVKNAYQKACQILALPPEIHYFFQKALRLGKKARTLLSLRKGAPSLQSTLWHLIQEEGGAKSALLVGYSEIHRGLAPFLRKKGVEKIAFCTRSPEKVDSSYQTVDRGSLETAKGYDMVSCATMAEEYLLRGLPQGARLLFDLSVPRVVDPALGNVCRLYNIEQVDERMEEKRVAFDHSLQECEDWIANEAFQLAVRYVEKQKEHYAFQC